MKPRIRHLTKACLALFAAGSAIASSHREAPFITTSPKVDGTDFDMFRSYEGVAAAVTKTGGNAVFEKPVDNIGTKTIADYPAYAAQHIHSVTIPGCPVGKDQGRVFVGQRAEGFAVNLGTIFDLVNAPAAFLLDPANMDAAGNGGQHTIQKTNVTMLAIEVHRDCLTAGGEPVIGGWTSASLRQARLLNGKPGSGNGQAEKAGGAWTQVSRLGNPLVNEVVIGLPDKDRFNASSPKDDTQFLSYVTHPTLPALLGVVLGATIAPTNFPRTELATTFLTGITGINKPAANPTPSQMLRLKTAIAPLPFAAQNRLGVAGNALAGGTDNAGSAVLPLNRSTAIGQPWAVHTRPKTICGSSRLPSREWPRAANSQQRPVSQVEVRSYSTSVAPTRCWRARRRSMALCASCSQSSARYRSTARHCSTPSTRPSEVLAVSSDSWRWVASLEAGSITRAASMASSSGCNSWGAEPNHTEAPQPRALPSTAAT